MPRPCARCVAGEYECIPRRPRTPNARSKGLKYASNVCDACKHSKARCGKGRPCPRCIRLGIACLKNSPGPNNAVSPFGAAALYPLPDLEANFRKFSEFLGTVSPFALTDLLTGPEMLFRSSVACATSAVPSNRRRDLLTRFLDLAPLDLYAPVLSRLAHSRVKNFLELSTVEIPASKLNDSNEIENSSNIDFTSEFDSSESDKALLEYYLYEHQFLALPECLGREVRPGVLVNVIMDTGGGNVALVSSANSEAELYTGYTSEQYSALQNSISSGFTAIHDFPEVLKLYHRDDIHKVMGAGLLSLLSGGNEVAFEARLVHSSGHIVQAKGSQMTMTKPNGQVKVIATAVVPLTFH